METIWTIWRVRHLKTRPIRPREPQQLDTSRRSRRFRVGYPGYQHSDVEFWDLIFKDSRCWKQVLLHWSRFREYGSGSLLCRWFWMGISWQTLLSHRNEEYKVANENIRQVSIPAKIQHTPRTRATDIQDLLRINNATVIPTDLYRWHHIWGAGTYIQL